jgi:hypothetical protein
MGVGGSEVEVDATQHGVPLVEQPQAGLLDIKSSSCAVSVSCRSAASKSPE